MDKQPNLPYLVDQVKFLFIPSRGLGSVTMHGLIKITQICLPKETRDYPIPLILQSLVCSNIPAPQMFPLLSSSTLLGLMCHWVFLTQPLRMCDC